MISKSFSIIGKISLKGNWKENLKNQNHLQNSYPNLCIIYSCLKLLWWIIDAKYDFDLTIIRTSIEVA